MSWLLGFGAKSRLGETPRLPEGRMMAYGVGELAILRGTMLENAGVLEDPFVRQDEEVGGMRLHGPWFGSVEPRYSKMRLLFEESALTRRLLQ
jgi:hypothetical protein